jgi:hypothetical protein
MTSDDVARGSLKAVMALAVGYVAIRLFAADPWLLLPVGLIALALAVWKDVCIGRAFVWFAMMGGLGGIAWGFYFSYSQGASVAAGGAIIGGFIVLAAGGEFDRWAKRPR